MRCDVMRTADGRRADGYGTHGDDEKKKKNPAAAAANVGNCAHRSLARGGAFAVQACMHSGYKLQ